MSRRRPPAPTRYNLLRLRRRLERVESAGDLLNRKRRALIRELVEMARPAADAREAVAERARETWPAVLEGLAAAGGHGLRSTGWPGRTLDVEIRVAEEWGVPGAEITRRPPVVRTAASRGSAPAGTGPAALDAARQVEALVDVLLDAATREMQLRRIARALARTTRIVNTLQRRLAPQLDGQARRLESVLEEREREEHTRLRRLSTGGGVRAIVAGGGRRDRVRMIGRSSRASARGPRPQGSRRSAYGPSSEPSTSGRSSSRT